MRLSRWSDGSDQIRDAISYRRLAFFFFATLAIVAKAGRRCRVILGLSLAKEAKLTPHSEP